MRKNNINLKNTRLRISVRELVEHAMQQGDLKGSFVSPRRGLEGTLGHQALQRSRGEGYRKEVWVSHQVTDHPYGINLEVQGRIDGIYKEDNLFVVEEIKTTHRQLEDLELDEAGLHFSQAKIYGFLFSENFKQSVLTVRLVYYQLKTTATKAFSLQFEKQELDNFFSKIVDHYLEGIKELYKWQEIRNRSIETLAFPFSTFRQGQDEFMAEVSNAISQGYNLYVQAPTGLGKTVSVLYPSIRAIVDNNCTKIFYLTARTTTREAPELILEKLRNQGLRLKSIVITAKEKTCFQDEMICNPDYCEYLFNYFGKINGAIRDIFNQDRFSREVIESCARKHKVCPFELSLDLSVISDCIICDYNYFFDPRVQLARYESETRQPYVYLVDEAHNLVERSRDMHSASLHKKDFLACKRLVDKKNYPEIYQCLATLDSCLLDIRKNGFEESSNEHVLEAVPGDLLDFLIDLMNPAETLLTGKEYLPFRDTLLELYFKIAFFLKIHQLKSESDVYTVVMYRHQSDLTIKLLCLDATEMLKRKIDRGQATIFFSATLTPEKYFTGLLGGTEQDRSIQLPSPFPTENKCLCLVDNISTRYRDRDKTYDLIAQYLKVYLNQKQGNYLVFFPSYRYLEEVLIRCEPLLPGITLLRQQSYMSEEEREHFIAEFTDDRSDILVGFVVMGGIFGESIDLPGNRLNGVAIIGAGLPQVNLERNLIRQYYDQKSENGFHFSYTFPGMNKVLQAAGRLIRTETDKGSLLLIDDRFANKLYQRLFPPEWQQFNLIRDTEVLKQVLDDFWN